MNTVKALVLTGYGLNCDYETHYSLQRAGAEPHRVHMNRLIGSAPSGAKVRLKDYHILVLGGGFSWADDHGAGVLMAAKLRNHLGEEILRFIADGRLVIGICNGFQALVNLGLLPAFDANYHERRVALISNDRGNFIDTWVRLRVDPDSPCVFTRGIDAIEMPVRHGEGKFYAIGEDLERLRENHQIVLHYSGPDGRPADGRWPLNPNGSLMDIAGICDPTGRVFGLMPHPEAFNHWTNHPRWTRLKEERLRRGETACQNPDGDGIRLFANAVAYIHEAFG